MDVSVWTESIIQKAHWMVIMSGGQKLLLLQWLYLKFLRYIFLFLYLSIYTALFFHLWGLMEIYKMNAKIQFKQLNMYTIWSSNILASLVLLTQVALPFGSHQRLPSNIQTKYLQEGQNKSSVQISFNWERCSKPPFPVAAQFMYHPIKYHWTKATGTGQAHYQFHPQFVIG